MILEILKLFSVLILTFVFMVIIIGIIYSSSVKKHLNKPIEFDKITGEVNLKGGNYQIKENY
jgi:hypothetical protein